VNARSIELAERRRALLVRSDEDRAALAAVFGGLERKFAVADTVVKTARRLGRHRALVGAAGLFMVFAPFAFRSWMRRALWLVPLALEGYRAARARDDAVNY
jgi:hypothetical protein